MEVEGVVDVIQGVGFHPFPIAVPDYGRVAKTALLVARHIFLRSSRRILPARGE